MLVEIIFNLINCAFIAGFINIYIEYLSISVLKNGHDGVSLYQQKTISLCFTLWSWCCIDIHTCYIILISTIFCVHVSLFDDIFLKTISIFVYSVADYRYYPGNYLHNKGSVNYYDGRPGEPNKCEQNGGECKWQCHYKDTSDGTYGDNGCPYGQTCCIACQGINIQKQSSLGIRFDITCHKNIFSPQYD